MTMVVVERSVQRAVSFDALAALEAAVSDCLARNRVQPRFSYLSRSGLWAVCIYQAPDAESVRTTQDEGGLPYDRVWSAHELAGPPRETPESYEFVVAQRAFPPRTAVADVKRLIELSADCFERNRVRLIGSLLSLDGRRMICHYRAPDAESVRIANQQSDLPFERIWSGQRYA